MNAIEIKNVSKYFGRNKVAVENLNFSVNKGEVFGFLGPNGAGKSTTIEMIMDYIHPSKGSISVMGYNSQMETKEVRKKIGILPDEYGLYDRLSGIDHLKFANRMNGSNENPMEIIRTVGLDEKDAQKKVRSYSSGMKQRLALGMALSGSPDVLILDEPSKGLDPQGIRRVRNIIRERKNNGVTVFFSSHLISQVEAVCDSVGIIKSGELLAVDTIENLRKNVKSQDQLVLKLESTENLEPNRLESINGVSNIQTNGNLLIASFSNNEGKIKLIHELHSSGILIKDIKSEETSLEDLFAAYLSESDY